MGASNNPGNQAGWASVPPKLVQVAERFEAEWQEALCKVSAPDVDSFLHEAEPETAVSLRQLLETIDQRYRQRIIESAGEPTAAGVMDATIVAQPQDAADSAAPPREPPSREEAGGLDPHGQTVTYTPSESEVAERSVETDAAAKEKEEDDEHAGPAGGSPLVPTVVFDGETDRPDDGATALLRGGPVPDRGATVTARFPELAGYEILGELGRGGMGVVYRARQQGLNRIVALKMILAAGHADSADVVRFKNEAEAVARLGHPNIVQIYEIGECEGLPFFSLEFVDGRSLEEERDGKPLPPARAAELTETLARAMHYTHERGIVHRDLKPANVLLTRDGVPKVTDFGLVKQVEDDSGQTRTGTIMGTPSYMAPEQAWGRTDVGPPADVYALGAVMYALLTGRPPFLGPTPLDTVVQLRQQEAVAPSHLQPGIPRDLETICLKCLQKDPARRYASAQEMAEDLRRFRAGEPIQARPVTRLERVWRWCKRNRSLATAAGIAAVLAASLMIGGPAAAVTIFEQKQNAARSAEIAGRQRNLSVEALNMLVERVPTDLKGVPGTETFKRNILLTAMDGLNKVADEGGTETKEFLIAKAHAKMGESLLLVGEAKAARQQFRRSHGILESLAKTDEATSEGTHKLRLGRSFRNLGQAAEQLDGPKAAEEFFRQSLKFRREALAGAEDPLFVKQEIAQTLGHLGRVILDQGRPQEAMRYFRQSADYRDEWLEKAPRNDDALREDAGTLHAFGNTYLSLGRPADAAQHYEQALKIMQPLTTRDNPSFGDRGNAALWRDDLATAHLLAGEAAKANKEYLVAVNRLEELSSEVPQHAYVKRRLAGAHYRLAVAIQQNAAAASGGEQAAEAEKHLQRSAELREELVNREPNNIGYRQDLLLSLARLGRVEEGGRIADELYKQKPEDPGVLFHVACGYALCGAADESEQSRQNRDKAVRTLHEAVEHGYQGGEMLKLDPDLAPIRNHAGFQKLLERLNSTEKRAEARDRGRE